MEVNTSGYALTLAQSADTVVDLTNCTFLNANAAATLLSYSMNHDTCVRVAQQSNAHVMLKQVAEDDGNPFDTEETKSQIEVVGERDT